MKNPSFKCNIFFVKLEIIERLIDQAFSLEGSET